MLGIATNNTRETMFGTQDLLMFVVTGFLLNVTPGADTLFIVGRSTALGFKAGVMAALGIAAGCLVHVFAAVAGLSALIAASPTAYTVVKYLGGAYLVYLGFRLIFERVQAGNITPDAMRAQSLGRVFLQGFLTNALNPKVALFFLALLPQFVSPESNAKWQSMLFLGLLFNFNGTLWNVFVAWSAARMARALKLNRMVHAWLNRCCGGMLMYFGIKLIRSDAA
jgi:threonine/homoserine/homoserine lactone efflux protein